MNHNFQKKVETRKRDEDWTPGKSHRAGYYDSNAHDFTSKKELENIKGVLIKKSS